jgi:hypothetical protein
MSVNRLHLDARADQFLRRMPDVVLRWTWHPLPHLLLMVVVIPVMESQAMRAAIARFHVGSCQAVKESRCS